MAGTEAKRTIGGAPGVLALGLMFGLTFGAAWGAPPTIVAVDPPPAQRLIDGSALDTITVTFDSNVFVPDGAVWARTVDGGLIDALDVSPLDVTTNTMTITFPAISDNRLTLVLDYSITNDDGEALDGEIDAPRDPLLPSGDGEEGGQSVFQFSVLQGDISGDGVVDAVDLALLHAGANDYDPGADLNGDGVVDDVDQDILLANAGAFIPKTDGVPPSVLEISPSSVPLATGSIEVTFTEAVDAATLDSRSVHVVGENGVMLFASGEPIAIDDDSYEFPFTNIACEQNYTVKVSNAIGDVSGELLVPPAAHTLEGDDTTPPQLACPEPMFVNSTDSFSLRLDDIPMTPGLQAFLRDAVVDDACTATANIDMETSLDDPTDRLPLGVNKVLFTATDAKGNIASCEGTVIVVPAVPLVGADGANGADGSDGVDGQDGQDGDPGQDGIDGRTGVACWDVNVNGVGDPDEDVNEDGLVNVLDCRGADGAPGGDGQDGTGDQDGTDGGTGDPPVGDPVRTTRRLCGALGMIPFLLTFAGLVTLRSIRFRHS